MNCYLGVNQACFTQSPLHHQQVLMNYGSWMRASHSLSASFASMRFVPNYYIYVNLSFSKCFLSLSTSMHSEEALEHLRRANKHGRSWDNLYPITLCREFLSVTLWVTLNIIRITCAEPGFVWIKGKQALVSILS